MLITTKKGDGGMSEYFGKRVSKGGKILEAVGTLDELQAAISITNYKLQIANLDKVIEDLHLIMGSLGEENRNQKLDFRIKEIEKEIEKLERQIKIGNRFIVFKSEKGVKLNWIRTIVRRAERRMMVFKDKNILVYLNRLSDYIYLLALKEEV